MGRLYAAEKLIELMILYRRFADDLRAEDPAETAGEGRAILRYLYTHSGEKLTLAGTAELFFLSESALSRQISKLTGTTFKRLLSGIRVEKAADYLLYTELTLNEIARLVGFVDASHLSRHFVAEMEVTPMNYRRIYAKTRGRSDRSEKATALALAEYVLQNYSDETLSAGRAAERFGVSVTEMNRLLLYYAGRSFDALLHEVRINRACELLASTDFLILDVAVEVGYRNIKTFNLNFLKIKAMTPTQFRASVTLQKADGSETGRTGRRRGRDK
jgi:AraC-like DNA-binding protein